MKGIKLPAPDMMLSRPGMHSPLRKSFGLSPTKPSATPDRDPMKSSATRDVTSPLKQGIESLYLASPPAPVHPQPEEIANMEGQGQQGEDEEIVDEEEANYEPIHLQDFLNSTNIHFMELTTTKRRHTTAPGSIRRASRRSNEVKAANPSLDDSVAAGFCTLPMLELYQHVSDAERLLFISLSSNLS